jgi:hypothetical protein
VAVAAAGLTRRGRGEGRGREKLGWDERKGRERKGKQRTRPKRRTARRRAVFPLLLCGHVVSIGCILVMSFRFLSLSRVRLSLDDGFRAERSAVIYPLSFFF